MADTTKKNIYFLSDFHLGTPSYAESLAREKKIVSFLTSIQDTASVIFIVGDMFDFWFEYKTTVPKGYVRLLGKLAELTDKGIQIHFFVGNHDMWMSGYFEEELNIPVYYHPKEFIFQDKKFYIGHGDGLGPGDHNYKFLKSVFRNRLAQRLFGAIHPSWGLGVANYFSRRSRAKTGEKDVKFLGEEGEWLIIFCRQLLAKQHVDFFVFGHRHYPIDYKLTDISRYINLGDWLRSFTYAVWDGNDMHLKTWEG